MRKLRTVLLVVLPALAVMVGLCLISQPLVAQNSASPNANQQQPAPQDDPKPAAEAATFTGKIVKSGGKLVLTDATNQTTYQLDDQQKAKEYVNKNVKVTGVLDASSGMIRVSAIEPV